MKNSYLTWDDYFLSSAFLAAMRSKDPCSQVGACIVNKDNKISAIGYNGMPRGCSDDKLPWGKGHKDSLKNKYMYVCHAEMNALMNKNTADVNGCKLYVALFPCNECAKLIIQSGIQDVFYYSDKHKDKNSTIASKTLLDMAKINYRKITPSESSFALELTTFDQNDSVNSNSIDSTIDNLDNLDINKPNPIVDINVKRTDYLSWEEYFMFMTVLSAKRSKNPSQKAGACIVNNKNQIVGIGYNGLPKGCNDEKFPWTENNTTNNENLYVCHEAMNAIMNKNSPSVEGCTLYVIVFPCNECAKIIIQAGIKDIVYYKDPDNGSIENIAAKKLLDSVGITYRFYESERRKIIIDFNSINWNST